jgi:glycosyltransferase involved in cell wall biosynthesis
MPALKPVKSLLFARRPAAFAPALAAVDRFVVLSGASRDLLARHGVAPERIAVIPQHGWKEAAADDRQIAPEKGRLLYVGWIEPRKGLHVVLRALAAVAGEFPELRLDVLGMAADRRYQAELEQFVRDHGLSSRVQFRQKIGREELLSELRRAWLVTVPEQWENMSPVILTEAMTAGACVLASRVGGVPQFVTEGVHGLLATRDDPAEFAERIRWSMRNPDAVLRMGQAARARALEVFDTAEIERRTLDLYGSLLRGSSASSVTRSLGAAVR